MKMFSAQLARKKTKQALDAIEKQKDLAERIAGFEALKKIYKGIQIAADSGERQFHFEEWTNDFTDNYLKEKGFELKVYSNSTSIFW